MHELLKLIISEDLPRVAGQRGRNLQMPGDPRYQPEQLRPFWGYDMWAAWLIIVEWAWLITLAEIGVMPAQDAALLTRERLVELLLRISTARQDAREYGRDGKRGTNHDILALLELMRRYLPKRLHRYLHLCPTSYDPISTAYALILQRAFEHIFWPQLQTVDQLWRNKIGEYAEVVQTGRTHLQTALPVTVGLWLAVLHHQFADSARKAKELAALVPGKFTGAVGTSAAFVALLGAKKARQAQTTLMDCLGLPLARYTTQIAPPQDTARFYFELLLLSGILANMGEDFRHLQASQFGEIVGAAEVDSSSSTMAHKKANPIRAEQNCGMHVDVITEFMRVALTLVSDLQRDLRWSCVMRGYSAVMVYGFHQLSTTGKLLKSLTIDLAGVEENFRREARLVMAELLHLCLQRQGYPGTHELVNRTIVPAARETGVNLALQMQYHLQQRPDKKLQQIWERVPAKCRHLLQHPERYTGDAIRLARAETKNKL